MLFADRVDAGRKLAARLDHLRGRPVVVLGLPRGGVPVAYEVASALGAPLDVIVVRKLGVPFQPELAMGAIGEDGARTLNDEIVEAAGLSADDIAAVERDERQELERRVRQFRGDRPRLSLTGATVVVVDDGLATGATARAACQFARAHGATTVILAVPVAPLGWEDRMAGDADEFVCVSTPEPFFAIGQFYRDFTQTTDSEVTRYLERAAHRARPAAAKNAASSPLPAREEDLEASVGDLRLGAHLVIPERATGVVLFAHGSGSSRHSPRNRFVSGVLNQAGLGTLLFDLLTREEENDRSMVFDIDLLADRLLGVTMWLRSEGTTGGLPLGYFGASTGAAAALRAAADRTAGVDAIVSRGGRPDLAGPHLAEVTAPTLLIVGGRDDTVLDLNRQAQGMLRCESRLVVIPGATHLFEEPGTLQAAAEAARDWFRTHLGAPGA